jgi:apolipoprotein N-acyltransferase
MAIAPASLPVFYNKVKLMPFTEYAPPPPVGEWLQVLGVARRSLQIGTHPHAIRLYGEPPMGTLICYESLFGWISAKQVCDGAQWLVAMTNDQWLLGAGVREQHADYCVLRAIETRRWVVRASTVGPTGFFSPLGERRTVSIGRPEVAAYTIECFSGMTLYSRWGGLSWLRKFTCLCINTPLGTIGHSSLPSLHAKLYQSRSQSSQK